MVNLEKVVIKAGANIVRNFGTIPVIVKIKGLKVDWFDRCSVLNFRKTVVGEVRIIASDNGERRHEACCGRSSQQVNPA